MSSAGNETFFRPYASSRAESIRPFRFGACSMFQSKTTIFVPAKLSRCVNSVIEAMRCLDNIGLELFFLGR